MCDPVRFIERKLFPKIFIAVLLLGFAIATYAYLTDQKEVVVSNPVNPELRIIREGSKIDTLYIYKFK